MVVTSPRNRTKPSYDVPDNVVVLDDDDEDDVTVQKPPATSGGSGGVAAVSQQRLYLWHQVAAHMRRERMLAEQIRATAGAGPSGMMTSPQYFSDNNSNIDPMIQFQAEVLQRQYLLYAHFYNNNNNININNINRAGLRPVLGVNPASRVIRKPSSGGAAAGRLQYGYVHGGGAVARLENPFGMAPTRARVMNNSGPTGLGLRLGVGGGEIEPEGIDLTLKL